MKVEILRSVMISGEPVSAGSFIDLEDANAHLLIGMGKAAIAAEAPAPPAELDPAPVVESEVEPAKPVRKARMTAPITKD
jgi:hypothetical protein